MPSRKYRSAMIIIQSILEELIKEGKKKGIVKSNIYKKIGLKTTTGEKYISQLIGANYIKLEEEPWGNERVRHKIYITKRGIKRFQLFMQLNSELEF